MRKKKIRTSLAASIDRSKFVRKFPVRPLHGNLSQGPPNFRVARDPPRGEAKRGNQFALIRRPQECMLKEIQD